jgi:hypothetical protein
MNQTSINSEPVISQFDVEIRGNKKSLRPISLRDFYCFTKENLGLCGNYRNKRTLVFTLSKFNSPVYQRK